MHMILRVLMAIDFFFFKQKTAYEIPLCDWSSDVCSSDLEMKDQLLFHLPVLHPVVQPRQLAQVGQIGRASCRERVYSGVEISVVAGSLKKKERTAWPSWSGRWLLAVRIRHG